MAKYRPSKHTEIKTVDPPTDVNIVRTGYARLDDDRAFIPMKSFPEIQKPIQPRPLRKAPSELPKTMPLGLNDSVWIYNGPMAHYSVKNNVTFDKGVPTYAPYWLRVELKKTPYFEIYTPEMPTNASRPIFVQLPKGLLDFLASATTLAKIRKLYPTCAIHVLCNPQHAQYIPMWGIKNLSSLSYLRGNGNYYRTFDLRDAKIYNRINAVTMYSVPRHILILQESGLYEDIVDKDIEPVKAHIPGEGAYIVGGAEKSSLSEKYSAYNGSQAENLAEILKADKVICLSDCDEAIFSASFGKWVTAFIRDDKYNRKVQYKALGITVYKEPTNDNELAQACKIIDDLKR